MIIKYHGHSCFSVISNDYTIVLDPYCDIDGLEDVNLKANEVITSHSHKDHAYVEGVTITKAVSPFTVNQISTYHDDNKGSKRGLNFITVLEAENKKIVHLGDLGHLLDESVINEIKDCDVLMIPVGGFFTIDASHAVKIIENVNPKNVIPMHYRDGNIGYDVLGTIDDFIKLYNKPCLLVRGYEEKAEI